MSDPSYTPLHGTGLGLRREFLAPLAKTTDTGIDFYEVAPENWMRLGGKFAKAFRALTEKHRFTTHGLSLSIGSPAPLDEDFVKELKVFLNLHKIEHYTEHLTFCSDAGHLYDLLPIPFTEEAINYVAERIQRVQDILGMRIGMENASYYAAPGAEMTELEFFNAVIKRADCDILLDINNIYVNSINHNYDPLAFLSGLDGQRIRYAHIAGHYVEAEDLRVDTHGSDVCEDVWQLLDAAYAQYGVFPTLLERDFNIPPLPELLTEAQRITQAQHKTKRLSA